MHPAEAERDCAADMHDVMFSAVSKKLASFNDASLFPLGPGMDTVAAASRLAAEAVRAFFQQDLLAAAKQMLAAAKGSFGLLLSHSLDAGDMGELIMAARGQTMSAAIYPHLNIVLWGSEASATKAAMTMPMIHPDKNGWNEAGPVCCQGAFRFDLDAVNGEVPVPPWAIPSPSTLLPILQYAVFSGAAIALG